MTVEYEPIHRYAEYDDEDIKHLHEILLSMLKDFVKICDENDIKYVILYGTHIGAIRHKGFIPWDDEIDIGMLREDYEKLWEVMKNYDGKYYLYDWRIRFGVDESCYTPKTLFCLKNTRLKQYTMDFGIYIDINVFDDYPVNKIDNYIFIKILDLVYFVIDTHRIIQCEEYSSKVSEKIGHIINFINSNLVNIPNIFVKLFTKTVKRYQGKSNMICDTHWSYNKTSWSKNIFDKIVPVKFEDMDVNMLEDDTILKFVYGDYMKIPPKEERTNHEWEIIDFGEY